MQELNRKHLTGRTFCDRDCNVPTKTTFSEIVFAKSFRIAYASLLTGKFQQMSRYSYKLRHNYLVSNLAVLIMCRVHFGKS